MFAVFDLPLGLIWKGGGSSISSVNMVQTVPNDDWRKTTSKAELAGLGSSGPTPSGDQVGTCCLTEVQPSCPSLGFSQNAV